MQKLDRTKRFMRKSLSRGYMRQMMRFTFDKLRNDLGLKTDKELAERMGVDPSQLSKWTKIDGGVDISLKNIREIETKLGIRLIKFYHENQVKQHRQTRTFRKEFVSTYEHIPGVDTHWLAHGNVKLIIAES